MPNFVTIPAKIQDAYILSPVLQSTPTNGPKLMAQPANKRLSVKTSDQKSKRAIPSKNVSHMKQQSLNSSIGELLKGKKPADIGFTSVKVKELVYFLSSPTIIYENLGGYA